MTPATLLPWGPAREVATKRGPRLLAKAAPTEAFWAAWQADGGKALRAAGISLGRDQRTGELEACWWQPLPEAIISQRAEALANSRSTEASLDVPCPEGLAFLPFQLAGIAYALRTLPVRGVLIGDEMGTGKTIQTIGVINACPEIQTALVLCPNTLKLNWAAELDRWLVRKRPLAVAYANKPWPVADIVLMNYDIVHKFHEQLCSRIWDLLVCDEIHFLKDPKARRTIHVFGGSKGRNDDKAAVQPIPTARKLALTGTPIPNRVIEIFPVLNWLDRASWPNFFKFAIRYANAHKNGFGWDLSGSSNEDELQRTMREKCMVRRRKCDVLTELPAKRRQIIELPSDGFEHLIEQNQRAQDDFDNATAGLAAQKVLAEASDDPAAYQAAVARLRQGVMAGLEAMSRIRHETALAKAPMVVEHVEEALETGSKVLLFAHHLDVIEQLRAALAAHGVVVVTGDTPADDRVPLCKRFNESPDLHVFLGGIRAAGQGLNLQSSEHVIFAELDWTPGQMSQCEDRSHRHGQTKKVLVQHLVLAGSIDATMAVRLVAKQAVLDACLDTPAKQAEAAEPVGVAAPDQAPLASAPPCPPAEQAELLAKLRRLARVCDGAFQQDGCGYNKVDTAIGKSLAAQEWLTAKQAVIARRLVIRYRRQLEAVISA